MFTLKELFDDLAYGEFANIAAGNSPTGSITPAIYPRMISLINAALLDLHTRFTFSTKELILHQRAGKNTYYLRPEHEADTVTVEGGADPEKYIDGGVDRPPANDIIKVFDAYDATGVRIHINDKRYPEGIFTLESDILRMVPVDPPAVLSILYQAAYPPIVLTADFDPAMIEINCPKYLKNTISSFVASRYLTGKTTNSSEGQETVSGTFWARYEAECARIALLTLAPEIAEESEQFELNGWAS